MTTSPTSTPAAAPVEHGHRASAPSVGVAVAVVLVALAMAVPPLTGWQVHSRALPPLHADWDPRVGPGTVPAVLLALVGARWAVPVALRLRWGPLLAASYVVGLGWMLALALVDGTAGIGRILDTRYEYLTLARKVTDFPALMPGFVGRIRFDGLPDTIPDANWPPHIAGHPPAAFGFFVLLAKLGLGSGLEAGTVVTLLAATTSVAVLVTLRVLGAEGAARRAAPFLVLGPAAVWQCVSADAVFAAVTAWGTALLALGAVLAARRRAVAPGPGAERTPGRWPVDAWSFGGGVLLGLAVMMSYGLPLWGVMAVAVLLAARSWRPLPWAVLGALVVPGVFTWWGFYYWDALPAIHDRYWSGIAAGRPPAYWLWGDLADLAQSAGPLAFAGVAAGVAVLVRAVGRRRPPTPPAADRELLAPADRRPVLWLGGAAVVMVLAADASLMSMGEVERIWLPFVPWLLVTTALLPDRWRRVGVAAQVVVALVLQHLLATGW